MKIRIKDLEVIYDEEINNEIDYVKTVINNNYDLFLTLLGEFRTISFIGEKEGKGMSVKDNILYIDDISCFDAIFYNIVKINFNNDNDFDYDYLLPVLYLEWLSRNLKCDTSVKIETGIKLTDELLFSHICYIYFINNGNFSEFVNYLKEKKNADKIIDWLKNETVFGTYNYFLMALVNYFKQSDSYFFQNIRDISDSLIMQAMNNFFLEEKDIGITGIFVTSKNIDNLFIDFLEFINAPKSWYLIYEDLKQKDRIIFQNTSKDGRNSVCFKDSDGKIKILVDANGTIMDFIILSHEFIHYITVKDNYDEVLNHSLIAEFPSIFFEKLAFIFLKSKGFDNNNIDNLMIERDFEILNIYSEFVPFYRDINNFIENGCIRKEDKVKDYKEMSKLLSKYGKIIDESDIFIDFENEFSSLLHFLIMNSSLVINGYDYLISSYLSKILLEKINNDDSIIKKMIYVTNSFFMFDLESIVNLFEIKNCFNSDGDKKKKVLNYEKKYLM